MTNVETAEMDEILSSEVRLEASLFDSSDIIGDLVKDTTHSQINFFDSRAQCY